MAGNIKGIIVEIGGDTSGLQKALSKVNSATASLSKELRGINSLLKLDPKNTELLTQKQTVLNQQISTTEEKLRQLQQIKEEADNKMASGTQINEENYRALQREIINTQNKLSNLKNEASNWSKAGQQLIEWGEDLEKIASRIDNLGDKLTKSITLPITGVAAAGLTYDAQIEKYETAFKTFLGSAEAAGKAIKNIKEDAKKTPFDTTSLVKANQMLISTGVSADDAREDILALGEAVIATGGGNDELVRMASNLQQIKNAGQATAMDIRQFAYAGIDVYGILADYTGKSTQEVKKMKVSYTDLTKALKKASSQGGKYFGAMTNSSETLTGQISALKSEVQDGVGELTKSLMPIAKKVVTKARELIKEFDKLSDSQKENIVKIGLMVAAAGPLLKVGSEAVSVVGSVSKGIGTFTQAIGLAKNGIGDATGSAANLAKVMQGLTSPVGLAVAGITAATTAAIYFATKESDAQKAVREFAEEMENTKKSLEEYNTKIDEATDKELSHINSIDRLKGELSEVVDENGKVKEGYKARVNFILNELNTALGTEYKLNGDLIEGYKNLQQEIDSLIEKKRAEILLAAKEEKYRHAVEDEENAVNNLKNAYDSLISKQNETGLSYDQLKEKVKECEERVEKSITDSSIRVTLAELKEIKSIRNIVNAYEDATDVVKQNMHDQEDYINAYELFNQHKYDEIGNTVKEKTQDWSDESVKTIKEAVNETSKNLEIYKKIYESTGSEIAQKEAEQAEKRLKTLEEQLKAQTATTKRGMEDMAKAAEEGFNKNVDGATWGSDLSKQISSSLSSKDSKNRISNAASKVASWISSYLHFSLPEKGPLSDMDESMPDMLRLMTKGINSGKSNLITSAESLAEDMQKALSIQKDISFNNFDSIQKGINSKIIDQTKTIFTTPNIVINAQDELTPAKMNSIIDTINRRLGSKY